MAKKKATKKTTTKKKTTKKRDSVELRKSLEITKELRNFIEENSRTPRPRKGAIINITIGQNPGLHIVPSDTSWGIGSFGWVKEQFPPATDKQVREFFKSYKPVTEKTKLQRAEDETALLRKQFSTKKVKKIKNIKARDIINKHKNGLGCQFDFVVEIFSEILGEDLTPPTTEEGRFKATIGAIVFPLEGGSRSKDDPFQINRVDSDGDIHNKDGNCYAPSKRTWRPATIAEVKKYAKDDFKKGIERREKEIKESQDKIKALKKEIKEGKEQYEEK